MRVSNSVASQNSNIRLYNNLLFFSQVVENLIFKTYLSSGNLLAVLTDNHGLHVGHQPADGALELPPLVDELQRGRGARLG